MAARAGGGLRADLIGQYGQDGLQDVDHRQTQALAGAFKVVAQGAVDDGGEHRAWFGLDAFQHAVQLEARPYQAPAVVDYLGFLELADGGARDRVQRLACGVGDQMEVDSVLAHDCEDSGDNRAAHGSWRSRKRKLGTANRFLRGMKERACHRPRGRTERIYGDGSRTCEVQRMWMEAAGRWNNRVPRHPQPLSTTPSYLKTS